MAELSMAALRAELLAAKAAVLGNALALRRQGMPEGDVWRDALTEVLLARSNLASLDAARVEGRPGSSIARLAAASGAC